VGAQRLEEAGTGISMTHLSEIELVMALDGEMEPRQAELAMRHMQLCAECRNEFEKLRGMSERVGAYQGTLYSYAVTKDVESTQEKVPSFGFRVSGWKWAFAAAALVIVAALLLSRPVAQKRDDKAVADKGNAGSFVAKNAPQDDKSAVNEIPSVTRGHRVRTASDGKDRTKASGRSKAAAHDADKQLAQFTELPFSDASLPLDGATVVRVELPAAALRQAGVPVEEDNASAMLQADVVLGVDGLPRGIRLVKNAVPNHAGTN
jgi:hypothetical protein